MQLPVQVATHVQIRKWIHTSSCDTGVEAPSEGRVSDSRRQCHVGESTNEHVTRVRKQTQAYVEAAFFVMATCSD